MKEIKLLSGAVLKITLSPFAESKALYQAILDEFKGIEIKGNPEIGEIFKNMVCMGFSSRKIESALEVCFKRCTYDCGKGALKIDKDTFEPAENRQDYTQVCIEVAKENIAPFMKSLFAEYQQLLSIVQPVPA